MNLPLNQQWFVLIEGQLYLSVGRGHITAEMIQQADQDFLNQLEASQAPLVHVIHDVRRVLSIPALSDMQKNKAPRHPRMGYTLTIGAFQNPIMRFIISLSLGMTQVRYRDVDSLAAACTYLVEKDPSLPPLNTWNIPYEVDVVVS